MLKKRAWVFVPASHAFCGLLYASRTITVMINSAPFSFQNRARPMISACIRKTAKNSPSKQTSHHLSPLILPFHKSPLNRSSNVRLFRITAGQKSFPVVSCSIFFAFYSFVFLLYCFLLLLPVFSPCKFVTTRVSIMSAVKRIIPLLDRVLVQRVKAETKTATGILLPEKAVEKLNEGVVVSVGPGNVTKEGKTIPIGLAEGDRVLLPSYGGSPINLVSLKDKEYLLYRAEEILAKLE
ncbi:chaperonin 10 kd subunit-domain-containing protein [Coemansia spiralis]|nr:chaperonin 10 kd subunit-domain-containing protein [Coemansia spiralis]